MRVIAQVAGMAGITPACGYISTQAAVVLAIVLALASKGAACAPPSSIPAQMWPVPAQMWRVPAQMWHILQHSMGILGTPPVLEGTAGYPTRLERGTDGEYAHTHTLVRAHRATGTNAIALARATARRATCTSLCTMYDVHVVVRRARRCTTCTQRNARR